MDYVRSGFADYKVVEPKGGYFKKKGDLRHDDLDALPIARPKIPLGTLVLRQARRSGRRRMNRHNCHRRER